MALKFLNNGYFAGKVGIGTPSPSTSLHIDQSSNDRAGGLYIERNASNYGLSMFVNSGGYGIIGSNGTFTTDILTLDLNSGNVGIGDTTPLSKLEVAGSIKSTNYDTSHTSESGVTLGYNVTESMAYLETWTSKPLTFRTYNYQAFNISGNEAMRIDTSRNVGIGTTSPATKLHAVLESSSTNTVLEVARFERQTTGTAAAGIGSAISFASEFQPGSSAVSGQIASLWENVSTAAASMTFSTWKSGVGISEAMRITNSGNVGIGITNPSSYDSNADNLVIGSIGVNDKNGITIVGGDTDGRGAIYFADTTQNSAGYITYKHADNSMLFGTSDATRIIIDSAGSIQFNNYDSTNQTGTPTYLLGTDGSGNVVKTNTIPGSAAGPYLPLAGGTMTGDLNLTYAYPRINLTDTNHNSDYSIINNDGTFSIYDITNNSHRLSISAAGNATFAGNVTVSGTSSSFNTGNSGTFVTNDASNYPRFTMTNASAQVGLFRAGGNAGGMYIGGSGDGFRLYTSSFSQKLFIDTNGNATFSGKITSGNDIVNATAGVYTWTGDTDTYIQRSAGNEITFKTGASTALVLNSSQNATFSAKAYGVAPITSDPDSTIATKGYVQSVITGATIYRGTWNPDVSLNSGYGNPNLNTVTQTSGYYYICSADGAATPNGATTEPNTWNTGDWVIWNDDVGTSGEWQKIDNSSVLSGVGTGQTVALWQGPSTVTDSETLGNAPITVSGSDTTFTGTLTSDKHTINSSVDGILTLNQTGADTGWNYIEFNTLGGRQWYVGMDNNKNFDIYNDNIDSLGLTIDYTNNDATFGGSINGGDINLSSTNNAIIDPLSVGNILRFTDNDPTQNNNQITGTIEWETKDSNNPGIQSFITTNSTNQGKGRLVFGTGLGGSAVEKMRIDSDGNVGIGVTAPDNKLMVQGDSTNGAASAGNVALFEGPSGTNGLKVFVDDTENAAGFQTISADDLLINPHGGNVGIGTAGPVVKLEIQDSTHTTMKIRSGNNDNILFAQAIQSNDARIGTDTNTPLAFYTNASERMRITSAGNVGIGTTSPDAILETSKEVAGNQVGALLTNTRQAGTADSVSLNFGLGRTADGFIFNTPAIKFLKEQQWTGTGSTVDGSLVFSTIQNETVAERMRIFSNGNVNIGVAETGSSAVTGPFVVTHSSSRFLTSSFEEGTVSLSAKNNNNNLESLRLAGDSIKFFNGTNTVGSQKMVILSSGNVGIGTTGPTEKLTIFGGHGSPATSGTGANGNLAIESSNGNSLYIGSYSASPYGCWLQASNYADQSITYPIILNPNGGNVGIGTTSPDSLLTVSGSSLQNSNNAGIELSNSHNAQTVLLIENTTSRKYEVAVGGSANSIGNGSFYIYDGTAGDARLVIDSSGNVGIGTDSPNQRLDVAGNVVIPYANGYFMDTVGAGASNFIKTVNSFETVVGTDRGSAGFGVFGNSNIRLGFGTDYTTAQTKLTLNTNGLIQFNAYNLTNQTGTPTYLLGTDASGNVVKTLTTPSPVTSQAASLYDLIPNGAFTTTYAFTSTAGTYAKVMQGDDVITANGTYTVQMFVSDYAVGGTQYSETYSGIMSWGSATNTNDNGGGTISQIVLHRSGHAANQGMTYLRTRETTSSEGNELRLEIMCNRTYTGASNVVFKFVRLI